MGRRSRTTELSLWMNGLHVGEWKVDCSGRHTLTYDEAWIASEQGRPISLSMPLRPAAPYGGDIVRHFFENLLPDNRVIRERLQARYGAPSTRAQDLLAEIGRDCVGALTLLPPGRRPDGFDRIDAEPLDDRQVERVLDDVTIAGRHADPEDFRISIAGAQEKTALLGRDGRWWRPIGATPTTHVFKLPMGIAPSGIDLSTSVENEWLCARILAAYGVPVALGDIGVFGRRKTLIVPRFDRRLSTDGTWLLRLPQEDFAQVFGVGPDAKYEAEGGPGIAAILERLRGSTVAAEDRADFFRTQVLFWMLAAIDGHAKNFSVFIEPRGRFRLTPRYDVLSAYPVIGRRAGQLSPAKIKMAMAVWGRNRHYRRAEIRRSHFEATAADCGLGPWAESLIDELVARTPAAIDAVAAGLPGDFPTAVSGPILEGLADAARRLSGDQGPA
ncbi:MAG: type II toxin-antitoxin system HipA family toxin [Burkholderiaceae bacterium]